MNLYIITFICLYLYFVFLSVSLNCSFVIPSYFSKCHQNGLWLALHFCLLLLFLYFCFLSLSPSRLSKQKTAQTSYIVSLCLLPSFTPFFPVVLPLEIFQVLINPFKSSVSPRQSLHELHY